MSRIKQLGWLGLLLTVIVFSVGFCAGAAYRNVAPPPAHSATPQRELLAVAQRDHQSSEFVKLAEEVSGIRKAVTDMGDRLTRIEATLSKR
jgi:hypothetical protein